MVPVSRPFGQLVNKELMIKYEGLSQALGGTSRCKPQTTSTEPQNKTFRTASGSLAAHLQLRCKDPGFAHTTVPTSRILLTRKRS